MSGPFALFPGNPPSFKGGVAQHEKGRKIRSGIKIARIQNLKNVMIIFKSIKRVSSLGMLRHLIGQVIEGRPTSHKVNAARTMEKAYWTTC